MEAAVSTANSNGGSHYRICGSIRSTHSQDGAIVLDIDQGQIFALNSVGSRILEIVKTQPGSNQADIVDHISQQFGVSPEVAVRDVEDFLQTLVQQHLIERLIPENTA